jgi:hypothetical protein
MNAVIGYAPKHPAVFRLGVRNVLSQRGNDMGIARFRKKIVKRLGDPAGTAVSPGQIGREEQYPLEIAVQALAGFVQQ